MGDIPYNMIYTEGDRLILELKNEIIFEGDYCSGGTNNIDLVNVRQHNNPNALGGLYSFCRNEIKCVYYLKESKAAKKFRKYDGNDIKGIDFTAAEYNRLLQMSWTYVYIQRVDSQYYKAVEKLMKAENIGVFPADLKPSKCAQLRFLAFCTWKEVFLFDLASHRHRYFYPELKEVLESEFTCKVFHKGGPLIDILFNNYRIYVQNAFDTQVVDSILQKSKLGKCPKVARTLPECLIEYINLPSYFLNMAVEVCEKSWPERPLRDDQLIAASQQVTFLLILKHKMERLLFPEISTTSCKVHNFYAELPYEEFTGLCQKNEVSENLAQLIPALGQLTVNAEHGAAEHGAAAEAAEHGAAAEAAAN